MQHENAHRLGSLWRLAIASSLFAFVLPGCGPKEVAYNSNSGADGVRDTATQLYLNTGEDDRCNAETGDNEDWRYMLIEEPGLLTVSVRVDNPRVDADIYLHDGFGRAIDRLSINESSDFYEFAEIEVPEGRYYFRIACNKGQSVYTVRAAFEEPEQTAEPATVYVVEAEPEPEPEPKPRKRKKRRKKKKKKKPKPDPKPEPKPTPKPEPEPVPETTKPPVEVTGYITLVTPSDGGKTKVTIRGIGSNNGVTTRLKGKLKGKGKTVKLFSCASTKCQGIVEADEEELKVYKEVIFKVPQQ